jgi:CelD/BcsL family acetyltransferase involved in cellulose biosynthesis
MLETTRAIISGKESVSDGSSDLINLVPKLLFTVIENYNDLLSVREEWKHLEDRSACTIFQTFDWQLAWWKHFGSEPTNQLFVTLIREGDRLVGIAPFFIQHHSMLDFRIYRQLKLIGSGLRSSRSPILSLERQGPADYLDIIAEHGCEKKVADVVFDFLQYYSLLWEEIEFQNLDENSIVLNHLLPKFQDPEFMITKTQTDVCPKIYLPESLDKYFASLRTSVRRNLRHAYKMYFTNPDYTLEEIHSDTKIESALQSLATLHQKRWNAIAYPGLFSDGRFRSMIHDLSKALAPKDRVWIKVLKHSGRTVAARLGFTYKGVVSDYLSGIDLTRQDPSTNYSGAGQAILLSTIKQGIENNYKVFDLLRGDEHYKFDLTSTSSHNYRVVIVPKNRRGYKRSLGYKFYSFNNSLGSRISCESTIFKLIAKKKGYALAVPAYVKHIAKRLPFSLPKVKRFTDLYGTVRKFVVRLRQKDDKIRDQDLKQK